MSHSRRELTIDIFKSLPPAMLKRLRIEDLEVMEPILCKEQIETFFKSCYQLLKSLNQWKQARGWCSGEANCMVKVGKNDKFKTCDKCRALARVQRLRSANGETKPIRQSDYGRIRAMEKKEKRAREARQ